MRHQRAVAEEDAGEVDVEDELPVLHRVFPRRRVRAGDAGAAHERVDPPQLAHGFVAREAHVGIVAHVDAHRVRGLADGSRALGERLLVAIPEAHARSGSGETLRDRKADPRRAAGHDGIAPPHVELVHPHLTSNGNSLLQAKWE